MSKKMIRVICLILAALMVFSIFAYVLSYSASAVTQVEIDQLQQERESLEAQQQDIQEQIELLEAEKASVMARKSALDQKIELNWKEIQLTEEQIRLYDDLILEKAEEVREAAEAESVQLQRYKARVRAMEETTPWTYLSILLQATSLTDFLGRVSDVTDIIRNDHTLREEYIEARETAERTQLEYEAVQLAQREKLGELQAEKDSLDLQLTQASNLIVFLEDDIDIFASAYEEKEAMQAEVQARIDQKVAELEAQQEAERKAREAYEERLRQQQEEQARQERERQEQAAREQAERERREQEAREQEAREQAAQAQQDAQAETQPTPTPEPAATPEPTAAPQPEPVQTVSSDVGYFIWPSDTTTINSRYGNRIHPIFGTTKWHAGVDIGAAYGDSVYAAAGGTVEIAEYSDSYGYYVVIYHSNGTTTLYAHMNSMPTVSVGQTITAGTVIGYVGSTGWASGPHLHFEIRVDGSTVDPLSYFNTSAFVFAADA